KVAQVPMTWSLMLVTVTFPVVARALADGDTERARVRVERDLALAAAVVLLGTATVVACAPQIVGLLFQRGAFTTTDTAATAGVLRVYALGLLAQTLVGALIRSYFSAGRATWYPLGAMAVGLAVTAGAGAWAVGPWGGAGRWRVSAACARGARRLGGASGGWRGGSGGRRGGGVGVRSRGGGGGARGGGAGRGRPARGLQCPERKRILVERDPGPVWVV